MKDLIFEFILLLGEDLTTKISLINFGAPGKVNVSLNYIITDSKNNTILTEEETIIVETQIEFIKIFDLPLEIEAGEYKLFIELDYEDQTEEAVSENLFQVSKKIKKGKLFNLLLVGKERLFNYLAAILLQTWIIFGLIILIIVLIIFLWRERRLRKFYQDNRKNIKLRTKKDIKRDIAKIKKDLGALEIIHKDIISLKSHYKENKERLNKKLKKLKAEIGIK